MRKLNIKKKIRNINFLDIKNSNLDNKKINLIDINFSQKNLSIKFQVDLMITLKCVLI